MGCITSIPNNKSSSKSVSISTNTDFDNCILNWSSSFCTQKYHWWPLHNSDPDTEDNINNLFARGGGLDKYDKLFKTESVEYQMKNHSIENNSKRSDKLWAGFCDRAASLSCLFQYPLKSVTVRFEGREIEFSPRDIEALMIIVSRNTTRDGLSVFYGNRNNMKKVMKGVDEEEYRKIYSIVKGDPLPLELIDVLIRFSKEDGPFVMDIDNGSAVWNYPFDKIVVTSEPIDYLDDRIPKDGRTIVYRFRLGSTAYPEKNMDIKGYVNYHGNRIRQKWLSDKNPDFLWKEYGRIDCWSGTSDINPEIDPSKVYEIYQQSIQIENRIINF